MASIPPTPPGLPRDLQQFLEAMRVAVVGKVPFLAAETVSSTETAVLVPRRTVRKIEAATAYNAGADAETLDAWIVKQGETTATAHAQVYSGLSVGAGDTVGLSALVGHVVPAGGSLVMEASGPLAVQVSGSIA